jgi:DNA-directed RNA polymerase specialized sigma subunit
MKRRRQIEPLGADERKLVEDHLGVAKFAAWSAIRETRGYTGCLTYEDLESIALYAICIAAKDYDPSKGFLFSTYASRKAKGYIQHALRDHSRLVRIPRSVLKERGDVRLLMSQGLTQEQIADTLKIPLGRVEECENSWKEIHTSLDYHPIEGSNSNSEDGRRLNMLEKISLLPDRVIDLLNRYYYQSSDGLEEWEVLFCKNFFDLYQMELE